MLGSYMIPEILYLFFLLCSWIAAMFSGIAFVYGLYMKKPRKSVLFWAVIFALCLVLVYLLMHSSMIANTAGIAYITA